MPLKEDLIKFILFNSSNYLPDHLENMSIESLVICKVEIELKLRQNKSDDGTKLSK
jgi:hypothetical protein